MSFPSPTPRQARVLWFSVTALAIGASLALLGATLWGMGWIIDRLSPVLIPLAVAGVIAYLLDPLVDWFERRMRRPLAILLVFALAVGILAALAATVVPKLVEETSRMVNEAPQWTHKLQDRLSDWLSTSDWGKRLKEVWDTQGGEVTRWFVGVIPTATNWLLDRVVKVASWFGLLAGFALLPVYVYYFLLEESRISKSWSDYLPLRDGKAKEELVFVLREVNDCMVVFFRGQVLVAILDGLLLTLGLWWVGLEFAVFIGVVAGFLSIVPFLGVMISLAPTLVLAFVQFGRWQEPLIILGIFTLVLKLDSWYLSPKIIGGRVGLHPLAVIISVMAGTCLLGGVIGGVLAIPLTAALRTLMFRYVWKKPVESPVGGQ
ncbi:MAG: AI-2E family transporter [Pedosphaera sp.]|nr:AI-2E family transporter [Pedosphaera sp.]